MYLENTNILSALVIGVDKLSAFTNPQDVNTGILLGDGAGAVLFGRAKEKKKYVSLIQAEGENNEILTCKTNEMIQMNGTKVYKYAVTKTVENIKQLIEKAQEQVSEEEMKKLEKSFRENSFTFEDYLSQLEKLSKMGNINDLIAMIPGLSGKLGGAKIDEKALVKNRAIIQSMTKKERVNPDIIKSSQRKRIAQGSGTTIQDVNMLIRQFEQSKEMMKQMKNKRGFGRLF